MIETCLRARQHACTRVPCYRTRRHTAIFNNTKPVENSVDVILEFEYNEIKLLSGWGQDRFSGGVRKITWH